MIRTVLLFVFLCTFFCGFASAEELHQLPAMSLDMMPLVVDEDGGIQGTSLNWEELGEIDLHDESQNPEIDRLTVPRSELEFALNVSNTTHDFDLPNYDVVSLRFFGRTLQQSNTIAERRFQRGIHRPTQGHHFVGGGGGVGASRSRFSYSCFRGFGFGRFRIMQVNRISPFRRRSLVCSGDGFPERSPFGCPVCVTCRDLITNGGFETGDLTGWEIANFGAGSWDINDGTFVPGGAAGPLEPISGNFDLSSNQFNPSVNQLWQIFTLPRLNIVRATLSWSDRIRNFAGTWADPNQELEVHLMDTTLTTVYEEPFVTEDPMPTIQIGPNERSFDVTSTVRRHRGSEMALFIEQEDNLFFFTVNFDDIALEVCTYPF